MPEKNNKTNIKILMIAPTPFFADRGCHVRIYEEIKTLQKIGYEITLCTYHLGSDIDGIRIERTMNIPWYKKKSAGPSYHKVYLDFLLLLRTVVLLYRERFDLIHAHLHEGTIIGKIATILRFKKIPLVFDLQGSLTIEMQAHGYLKYKALYSSFRFIEKAICRMPDLILASSGNSRDFVIKELGMADSNIHLLPDGVDTTFFTPTKKTGFKEEIKNNYNIKKNSKVVVYLGVLSHYQGVDMLLQAARLVVGKFRNVHFLIMGYPNEDYYREMANNLGLAGYVSFPGRIDYRLASDFINIGDIAVSFKQELEANGKLYNYLACGLPVAATENPINREILRNNGVYVRGNDPEDAAGKILDLLKNSALRAKLAVRGRAMAVKEYSWVARGSAMNKHYLSLLDKNLSRSA